MDGASRKRSLFYLSSFYFPMEKHPAAMPGASLRFSGDAGAVEKVSLEGSFVARWGGPSGTPVPTVRDAVRL